MRKTHCKRGHELTFENIYEYRINETRIDHQCRECNRLRDLERNKKSQRIEYEKKRNITRLEEKKAYMRQFRINNSDKCRDRELQRCHRITLEEYNKQVKIQQNKCLSCGGDPLGKYNRLIVDHDHSCCPMKRGCCGECNRGLICQRCNLVLGEVKDNKELLQKLVIYLERFER